MKTRLTHLLFALLVVTVAGAVWAGQPTAPADTPEVLEAEVTVPQDDVDAALEAIDELFVEPSETGACCRGDCFAAYIECKESCDIGDQLCGNQCSAARDACNSNC